MDRDSTWLERLELWFSASYEARTECRRSVFQTHIDEEEDEINRKWNLKNIKLKSLRHAIFVAEMYTNVSFTAMRDEYFTICLLSGLF